MDRAMAMATSMLSSKIQSSPATSSIPPELGPHRLFSLRGLSIAFLRALLRLLILFFAPALSRLHFSPSAADDGGPELAGAEAAAARALSHVLSVVSRVPVASRKYELVRGLAERLLDDNLSIGGGLGLEDLNRASLSGALARTIRRLEAGVVAAASPPPSSDKPMSFVFGAVQSGIKKLVAAESVEDGSAEKMAAEALWLAGKLVECGGAAEAVGLWGAAGGLSRAALAAEPRLQVALVRVTAFLFKHVNAKPVDGKKEGEEEEQQQERAVAYRRMAMLTSWLPLLCRASNGTDAPTLSISEKAEMVRILDDTIEKLSWDEQEKILTLWLHHFTYCPNSDWPNLESCYTQWYAESRKLLLK